MIRYIVLFKCSMCEHEWELPISVSFKDIEMCPKCAEYPEKIKVLPEYKRKGRD